MDISLTSTEYIRITRIGWSSDDEISATTGTARGSRRRVGEWRMRRTMHVEDVFGSGRGAQDEWLPHVRWPAFPRSLASSPRLFVRVTSISSLDGLGVTNNIFFMSSIESTLFFLFFFLVYRMYTPRCCETALCVPLYSYSGKKVFVSLSMERREYSQYIPYTLI